MVKKDTEKNLIYVSNQYRSEEMFRDSFEVGGLNWIAGRPPLSLEDSTLAYRQAGLLLGKGSRIRLSVKLRHGEKIYACEAMFQENGNVSVKLLSEEDKGISPGQFAVFYDGDICLGGGMIVS